MDATSRNGTWLRAIDIAELRGRGRAVVKLEGKQLALFAVGERVFACNNRCPHEGYPLIEGHVLDHLDHGCVLTCNWHNWKFELDTGDNVYGGDSLRIYPTRVTEGAVWLDLRDAPDAQRIAAAHHRLNQAMDDNQYDRIARELARLAKAGADPRQGVARAIIRSHERLRDGMTHAYAASNGWLRLHDSLTDPAERLMCLAESVGHIAYDTLREHAWPYNADERAWSAASFLAAVEARDEAAAVALVRGALLTGVNFAALEETLAPAALAHHNDFGHSLIYLCACADLIARFGHDVELPLLLAYVRSLVRATREDLVPEFRGYAATLEAWNAHGTGDSETLDANPLVTSSIKRALAAVLAARTAAPINLFHVLLDAAASQLLRFDATREQVPEGTVADNIGWLDFTHAITFANAARRTCTRFPQLWPAALLQMALFVGRNSPYLAPSGDEDRWRVADLTAFDADCRARVLNHGVGLYIHSAHLLKTWLAARDEWSAGAPADVAGRVATALNRYLSARVHQKRTLRTARQAIDFVALED